MSVWVLRSPLGSVHLRRRQAGASTRNLLTSMPMSASRRSVEPRGGVSSYGDGRPRAGPRHQGYAPLRLCHSSLVPSDTSCLAAHVLFSLETRPIGPTVAVPHPPV